MHVPFHFFMRERSRAERPLPSSSSSPDPADPVLLLSSYDVDGRYAPVSPLRPSPSLNPIPLSIPAGSEAAGDGAQTRTTPRGTTLEAGDAAQRTALGAGRCRGGWRRGAGQLCGEEGNRADGRGSWSATPTRRARLLLPTGGCASFFPPPTAPLSPHRRPRLLLRRSGGAARCSPRCGRPPRRPGGVALWWPAGLSSSGAGRSLSGSLEARGGAVGDQRRKDRRGISDLVQLRRNRERFFCWVGGEESYVRAHTALQMLIIWGKI
jgi:hypothetical protein